MTGYVSNRRWAALRQFHKSHHLAQSFSTIAKSHNIMFSLGMLPAWLGNSARVKGKPIETSIQMVGWVAGSNDAQRFANFANCLLKAHTCQPGPSLDRAEKTIHMQEQDQYHAWSLVCVLYNLVITHTYMHTGELSTLWSIHTQTHTRTHSSCAPPTHPAYTNTHPSHTATHQSHDGTRV